MYKFCIGKEKIIKEKSSECGMDIKFKANENRYFFSSLFSLSLSPIHSHFAWLYVWGLYK